MTSPTARFEEVEHVADTALRVYGGDWKTLLTNAALGMFSLIADWSDAPPSIEREIELRAADGETLLVDWLTELLYLHDTQGEVYVDFEVVDASPNSLKAVARGTSQWRPQRAVKAVTFNELTIARIDEGYVATIVFDT